MDNDPSQTLAKARAVLMDMGYTMQKIPARSPDLNPIENVLHLVRKLLETSKREERHPPNMGGVQTGGTIQYNTIHGRRQKR